jgi:shikimate kinase/3-dehydroquinate synthase
MEKPNIILTGFMGTGKTTVGKLLANQLNFEFIDTDAFIEERTGKRIPKIFEQIGEEAFRIMEAEVAKELSQRKNIVISTGGRMMLEPNNAAVLSSTGRVFCLVATPEEIFERVSKDEATIRPLLASADAMGRIIELMRQRQEEYGQFPEMVTSDKTPDAVARILYGILQANPDLRVPITAAKARYEFIVGGGILPFVNHLAGITGPVAIITDCNVGPRFAKSCGPVDVIVEVSPGQRNKNLTTVQSICEQLIESGFGRNGTIIGLGGSVIIGLAGFVSAVYMRGVDCIHCPTTLLAMIDTSIGGKAGINLPQGKNLIGAFKQPKAVIADVATLQSLPQSEFACGMAEVIKHGLIAGGKLFQEIEGRSWLWESESLQPPLSKLQELVAQAIQVKVQVVQEDPFEKGRRAVLNLGHTFAHAIELASDHMVKHGEAVAMGLVAAANLSQRLKFCGPELQERIESILKVTGLPTRIPSYVQLQRVMEAMRKDKKASSGRIRFVLLRKVGEAFVADAVPPQKVYMTLNALKA